MNQFLVVVGLLIGMAVALYFFWYRPKQAKKKLEQYKGCPEATHVGTSVWGICIPKEWGVQEHHQFDRPDGGFILVESPVESEEIQARAGEIAVKALQRMIDAATHYNPTWTKGLRTSDYNKILMIRPTATNMDGTPALLIGKEKYQSAGTVINIYADLNERGEIMIVLPQPNNWDEKYWSYFENSVYNEAEHCIEFWNDKNIFRQKAVAGDVHPHWPPMDAPLGFLSSKSGRRCTVALGDPSIKPVRV